MGQVMASLIIGSILIASIVTFQTKHIQPTWVAVAKYNLAAFPVMLVANTILFIAFTNGQKYFGSLPAVVGTQVGIYMLSLALLGAWWLKQPIGWHTLAGILLLAAGAWLISG